MSSQTATQSNSSVSWRSILSFVLAASFLAYEMGIQVSPGVMASRLMHDLSFGPAQLGFVMSAYYYSYSAMMIPAGLLFDRFSVKNILLCAVGLCVLGCFMFAHGNGALMLVFSRFFTGLGSAFAFIGVLVVAARCFPIRYYALLVGVTQLLAALGAIAGVTPVAIAVERSGWRHTMIGIAVVGLGLMVLLFFILKGRCVESDVASKASGSSTAQRHSLLQSLAVIFSRTQTYMVAAYSFCAWAPVTFFASLWGVPYLMLRYQLTSTDASIAIDVLWIGIAVAAPLLGFAVKYVGHRLLLMLSATIGFVCALAMLYVPDLSYSMISVLCFGVGVAAAANILCFDLVQLNNPSTEHAAAVGVNNIALVITGVILQPAVGLLLRWHAEASGAAVTSAAVSYHVADYLAGLWLMPVCLLAGLLVSVFCIQYPSAAQRKI